MTMELSLRGIIKTREKQLSVWPFGLIFMISKKKHFLKMYGFFEVFSHCAQVVSLGPQVYFEFRVQI